jgi:hypothetical protein
MSSQETLISKLKKIIRDNPSTVKAEVAQEALDYDTIAVFFTDLAQNGCQSGMVTQLIYYADTAKFYDKYYDQIEELREDYEEMTGTVLEPKGDLKNWYAWFAFEETAFQLAAELELE